MSHAYALRAAKAGDLVNGWKLLRPEHKPGYKQRFWVALCPGCQQESLRSTAQCRSATCCASCAAQNRHDGIRAAAGRRKRLRFEVLRCCANRSCWVCAGTNHRVEAVWS